MTLSSPDDDEIIELPDPDDEGLKAMKIPHPDDKKLKAMKIPSPKERKKYAIQFEKIKKDGFRNEKKSDEAKKSILENLEGMLESVKKADTAFQMWFPQEYRGVVEKVLVEMHRLVVPGSTRTDGPPLSGPRLWVVSRDYWWKSKCFINTENPPKPVAAVYSWVLTKENAWKEENALRLVFGLMREDDCVINVCDALHDEYENVQVPSLKTWEEVYSYNKEKNGYPELWNVLFREML